MFDVPVDAWYLWVGIGAASVTLFAVATGLPTAAPPTAGAAADTVDTLAASEHDQTGSHPLDAREVKLGPSRISLRGDGGTVHATFAYGPVVPVSDGTLLWEVLQGARPAYVFESPVDLRRAAVSARSRSPEWQPADERLRVRTVTWEGVDVTLVAA